MYNPGIARIGRKSQTLDKSPPLLPITKIVVKNGDNKFTVGTDDGRTQTIESPFGSQKMAEDLLSRLNGYTHRPLTAGNAMLSPLAECGDGVTSKGGYTGLYGIRTTFGNGMTATIASPGDSDIDHEIPARPNKDRSIQRQFGGMGGRIKNLEELLEDYAEVKADIGDATAGLAALVKKDKDGNWVAAESHIYATAGDVTAQIGAYAVKSGDTTKTLVEVMADQIKLSSVATVNEGKLYAKSGLSVVGNTNLVGGVTLSGGGTLNVLAGSAIKTPTITTLHLNIDTVEYEPTSITSTDGTEHSALGA